MTMAAVQRSTPAAPVALAPAPAPAAVKREMVMLVAKVPPRVTGEQIRWMRKQLGLKQNHFGTLIALSDAGVRRLEQAESSKVNGLQAHLIAMIYLHLTVRGEPFAKAVHAAVVPGQPLLTLRAVLPLVFE